MGLFLSLTSVINKTADEVSGSLAKYAKSVNGGLEKKQLQVNHNNCSVIKEANRNTTIFNPPAYLEWSESSAFISRDLNAVVFAFHIHDGDFWMYELFANGKAIDQFNPIPAYWDDNISEDEMEYWKGNANKLSELIPGIKSEDIENYLITWDLETEQEIKAYPEDEFTQEDWQLLDFMRKLKLPYPLADDLTANGQTYQLWTKQLKLC